MAICPLTLLSIYLKLSNLSPSMREALLDPQKMSMYTVSFRAAKKQSTTQAAITTITFISNGWRRTAPCYIIRLMLFSLKVLTL